MPYRNADFVQDNPDFRRVRFMFRLIQILLQRVHHLRLEALYGSSEQMKLLLPETDGPRRPGLVESLLMAYRLI
jgi:hypothetical protein